MIYIKVYYLLFMVLLLVIPLTEANIISEDYQSYTVGKNPCVGVTNVNPCLNINGDLFTSNANTIKVSVNNGVANSKGLLINAERNNIGDPINKNLVYSLGDNIFSNANACTPADNATSREIFSITMKNTIGPFSDANEAPRFIPIQLLSSNTTSFIKINFNKGTSFPFMYRGTFLVTTLNSQDAQGDVTQTEEYSPTNVGAAALDGPYTFTITCDNALAGYIKLTLISGNVDNGKVMYFRALKWYNNINRLKLDNTPNLAGGGHQPNNNITFDNIEYFHYVTPPCSPDSMASDYNRCICGFSNSTEQPFGIRTDCVGHVSGLNGRLLLGLMFVVVFTIWLWKGTQTPIIAIGGAILGTIVAVGFAFIDNWVMLVVVLFLVVILGKVIFGGFTGGQGEE